MEDAAHASRPASPVDAAVLFTERWRDPSLQRRLDHADVDRFAQQIKDYLDTRRNAGAGAWREERSVDDIANSAWHHARNGNLVELGAHVLMLFARREGNQAMRRRAVTNGTMRPNHIQTFAAALARTPDFVRLPPQEQQRLLTEGVAWLEVWQEELGVGLGAEEGGTTAEEPALVASEAVGRAAVALRRIARRHGMTLAQALHAHRTRDHRHRR